MTRSHNSSSARYATNSPNTTTATAAMGNKGIIGSAAAAAAAVISDPAALLARGYTARYLGAVLNKQQVSALTDEEMERDLRHITAYQEAATRYHQLTYAANNRLQVAASDEIHGGVGGVQVVHSGASSALMSSYAILPVRIDPEEEKRVAAQAKRIQRAEAVREELEQHYVALRAHYVVTTQELQQLQADFERTMDFLQSTVSSTATTLAYHRARLEMTRNVAAALKVRTAVLTDNDKATAGTQSVAATDPAMFASGADSCPMLAAWLALEDDCKKNFAALGKSGSGGGSSGTGGNSSKAKGKNTIFPWACTTQPSMAPGIPILLSVLSTDPCKSLATGVGAMFGSTKAHNLTWLESHFPSENSSSNTESEQHEDLLSSETAAVTALREEVEYLEQQLVQEREANQALLVTTASARTQHDEWVAMISLVRQETEAVLHRHNVLLESDEVREAAERVNSEQVAASVAAAAANAAAATADQKAKTTAAASTTAVKGANDVDTSTGATGVANAETKSGLDESTQKLEEGDANEADDEGMEEEGEEGDDWEGGAGNNTTGKRNAATAAAPGREDSEESPGGSRKRRKV